MSANNGALTVNSVQLMADWVRVLNLWTVWGSGDPVGENLEVSGQDGRYAQPFNTDEANFPLRLVVFGHVKYDASPMSNKIQGLQANVYYLKSQLAPATSYSSMLTLPDASTKTASVQVRSLTISDQWGPDNLRVSLILTVLGGQYA